MNILNKSDAGQWVQLSIYILTYIKYILLLGTNWQLHITTREGWCCVSWLSLEEYPHVNAKGRNASKVSSS